MRKPTSKVRKTTNDDSDDTSNNSGSIQMELDLLAIKSKNAELTKAHIKLKKENVEMKEEIIFLRSELGKTEAISNGFEIELKTLAQEMSKCAPSIIDVLNLFLRFCDSSKLKSSSFGTFSQLLDKSCTPKAKTITHTVKPHTVNGTVLNLNPTISLTRLNRFNDQRGNDGQSSSTSHVFNRNSFPSTSTSEGNNMEHLQNENISPQVESIDTTNDEFAVRKSHLNYSTSTPLLTNCDDPLEMEDEVEPEELSEELDPSPVSRLTTIEEESFDGPTTKSVGEITIYLKRLSAENMSLSNSQNDSCSSIEVNVNDTRLNFETTVIENQEARVSKRPRTDVMVFSPHTNSTRVDSDDSALDDLSRRERRRTNGVPAVSAIQITPSFLDGDEDDLSPDPLYLLHTPSMSAMGDIDTSNFSRLDILTEPDRELTSVQPSASPPRNTRSKTRRGAQSKETQDGDSPRSSRQCYTGNNRRVSSFVSLQRGKSGDVPEVIQTPTIILERLEDLSPEHEIARSSPTNPDSDDPKENEYIPTNIQVKSKKALKAKKSRSPKRSAKRKKIDETSLLEDKIREVQIRLSNYVPEALASVVESPMKGTKRPSRAAKPTILKDASLKGKLRRMF